MVFDIFALNYDIANHRVTRLAERRGGSELYSVPCSAKRAVGTIKGSFGEAGRDNVFVNWQGEKIRGNAPKAGKGEAISAN